MITKKNLPLIVFSDDLSSWFGGAIKAHTKGNYNHVMIQHKIDKFATQNPGGYKEVPISMYKDNDHRLKYVYIDMPKADKKKILRDIDEDLKEGWFSRGYDYIGILGQFLGKFIPPLKYINNPWKSFCSEKVTSYYKDYLDLPDKLSPSGLNKFLKESDKAIVYARYTPED